MAVTRTIKSFNHQCMQVHAAKFCLYNTSQCVESMDRRLMFVLQPGSVLCLHVYGNEHAINCSISARANHYQTSCVPLCTQAQTLQKANAQQETH